MQLSRTARAVAVRLLLVGSIALGAGLALGHPWMVMCLALGGYLAWTLYHLLQLERWLRSRRRVPPPEGWGLWADIYDQLYRRQKADSLRRRRLVSILRVFREAAAALPDAIVILDTRNHIQWFNDNATRLLGLKSPQDLGAPLTNLVRYPNVNEWLTSERFDTPLLDVPSPPDESVRLSLRMIRYGSRQRLLVCRDISNILRLEQVRRDFVANVSHELRTPLTVVRGYLDMIEPEELPDWEPILREMRGQARRMTQIVEDLLTLSRLEANDQPELERVAMRPLLKALLRDAQALSAGQHRIELIDACSSDLLGSGKDILSAFSNLTSNAVRYTPAGGQITLRWDSHGAGAVFSVTDTGQGIPPQHLPRITERFYRVSTSRSRETGGTGLGLSIVKHVLHQHHAQLEIRSELGVGSTFSCVFEPGQLIEAMSSAREA